MKNKNIYNSEIINEIEKLKTEKYQTKNYVFLNSKTDLLFKLLNEELLSYLKISKLFFRLYSIKIKPEAIRNFAVKELKIETYKKRKNKHITDEMITENDTKNYNFLFDIFMEEMHIHNKKIDYGEMEDLSRYLKSEENNKNIFKMLFIFNKNNTDINKKLFESFLKNITETYNDDYMR